MWVLGWTGGQDRGSPEGTEGCQDSPGSRPGDCYCGHASCYCHERFNCFDGQLDPCGRRLSQEGVNAEQEKKAMYERRQLNHNVTDRSSYGHVLSKLSGHDSSLQSYRRMFLTAQSFLLSAAAFMLRLASLDATAPDIGAAAPALVSRLGMATLLVLLGFISWFIWIYTSLIRELSVSYLSSLIRRLEAGKSLREGYSRLMSTSFSPRGFWVEDRLSQRHCLPGWIENVWSWAEFSLALTSSSGSSLVQPPLPVGSGDSETTPSRPRGQML